MDTFLDVAASRIQEQEEEEAAAQDAAQHLEAPVVLFNRRLVSSQQITSSFLIIATTPALCGLLTQSFPDRQLLGTIVSPSVPLQGLSLQPSLQDPTCCIYSAGPASSESQLNSANHTDAQPRTNNGTAAHPSRVLVLCQHAVAPEQSGAWAKALLSVLDSVHTVILTAVSAQQYVGPGDPSQESLFFRLASAAAKATTPSISVPYLATGNVLGGTAAALLSRCQAAGRAAQALVSIDGVGGHGLHALREALQKVVADDVVLATALARESTGKLGPVLNETADKSDIFT